MKRTFIAVKLKAGQQLYDAITGLKSSLGDERIKWVDTGNMHITLAFLGDTDEDTIESVSGMVRRKCGDFGEFTFNISGTGLFKNINDPRIIWAGIESSEKLVMLYNRIKQGLEEIGMKTEDRKFIPHLTLGRIKWLKNKDVLIRSVKEYSSKIFQEVTIEEVVYYESILHPTGPEYIPISVTTL